MGEYVQHNGTLKKIGTAESLYYCTYQSYRRLYESGQLEQEVGSSPPGSYLRGDYRFRFGFPDEDEEVAIWGIVGWQNFDRGELIYAPLDWMADAGIEHYRIHGFLAAGNVPPRVPTPRYSMPCPQGPEPLPDSVKWGDGGYQYIEVVQQRPCEGALWTVVRCPFCGTRWRVPPEYAAELAAHILVGYATDETKREIARRMLAGYQISTNTPEANE